MQSFNSNEIGFAFSWVFRSSTIVLGTSGIVIGRMDELLGTSAIFGVSLIVLVAGALLFAKQDAAVEFTGVIE